MKDAIAGRVLSETDTENDADRTLERQILLGHTLPYWKDTQKAVCSFCRYFHLRAFPTEELKLVTFRRRDWLACESHEHMTEARFADEASIRLGRAA